MTSKRLQAITGDTITIEHPTLDLSSSATTSVTVVSKGITYNVLSEPPHIPHDHAMITGEYTLRGHTLRVRESVDTLQIGASTVRYENLWEAETGTLTVITHDAHDEGLALLSALSPVDTPLGVTVTATGGIEVASPPILFFAAPPLGLLQISPLTPAAIDMLPDWQGTPVDGGELFAANISRSVFYLILVTDSARVDIMSLSDEPDLDLMADLASRLRLTWTR